MLVTDASECKAEFKAFGDALDNPSSSWGGWGAKNTDTTLDALVACHHAKVQQIEGADTLDFAGGDTCLDPSTLGSSTPSDSEKVCVESISKFLANIGMHKNM